MSEVIAASKNTNCVSFFFDFDSLCVNCRKVFRNCRLTKPNTANPIDVGPSTEETACPYCYSLLSEKSLTSVIEFVKEKLQADTYDADTYHVSIDLPPSYSFCELIARYRSGFAAPGSGPIELRDHCRDLIIDKLSSSSEIQQTQSVSSDFTITIDFVNETADEAVLAFVQQYLSDSIRPHHGGKRRRMQDGKKTDPIWLNKTMVGRCRLGLTDGIVASFMNDSANIDFGKCDTRIQLSRDFVILGGRYCKYSRSLPQSPWFDRDHKGTRRLEGSVCETIATSLLEALRADSYKFSSSGREDVDVRMLGNGRPFAIQFVNARRAKIAANSNEMEELTKTLNSVSPVRYQLPLVV